MEASFAHPTSNIVIVEGQKMEATHVGLILALLKLLLVLML